MNVMGFFSKCLIVVLSLSLMLPVSPVSAADDVAATRMKHESPDTFIPGFRIILNADITDGSGIKEARCYFRAKEAPDFVFVDMQKVNGEFEALLPAPELGARAVNYFFLSLNGKSKVARSQVFEIVEQDTGEAKDLREAEQAKAKGKDVDLDSLKDRLMEKLEKEQKAKLKKHQTVKKDSTIQAKADSAEAPKSVKGFKDKIALSAVAPGLQYSMMKEGSATVTATSGGMGAGAVIAGLAVVAGGVALAAGGGGGGSSSTGTTPPPSGGGTTPPPSGGGTTPPPPPAGTQLLNVAQPNPISGMTAPFAIEIENFGAGSIPMSVSFSGSSLGNYSGSGFQSFPLPSIPGTATLTLTSNVTGACLNFHFTTNGGRSPGFPPACHSITGIAGDTIVLRIQ